MAPRMVFPRYPRAPDNPVAAEAMGWWYLEPSHGVTYEPRSWEEALLLDPDLAEALGVEVRRANESVEVQVSALSEFAFDAGRGSTQQTVLAEHVDARAFASGVLIVRFHRAPAWSAGTSTIHVRVFNTSVAVEEPATLFTEAIAIATVSIVTGTAAPQLYIAELTAPIAETLRIVLAWEQGNAYSTGEERFALSVELLGRS
jgi:hypothetical protein